METKAISFGRSLAVPFVQELANKGLTSVPPRYVHHDQDPPIISLDFCSPQVPVIDMQILLSEDFTDSELQKLDQACREWGFFQLINHEMSSRLVGKVKLETEEFFKLPMEEKSKESLEAYSTGLINVAARILRLIGKNLRMDDNEMTLLSEGRQSMSFNYYPPCPQPEQVIGLPPHSDASSITILHEINDVQGLQIKKDGMWIPVKPLPNAFIINIGDALKILSNGTYRSIEHRVTVNSLKERLSIATFCSPKMDGEISPAPSLVTLETPAIFRRISVVDYIKGLFSRKLDGKSYLYSLRIQNEQGKSN
ncbi:hypothetical protein EZV62_027073 [Acer yangbiense]|uniref:Fe2OG dioxygenase domain-containing protein n=1 Tax=Acer yangbiense TaxID=1000413 RepID=A0A5C7GTH6_9ROSI|nr:hypothetical protein EZV62_027073 [Acer yangbiense]